MTAVTAPSTTSLLSLRGVNKSFGAVNALTDIELDVSAGEVVALVGDNGAGKSTLVKVLAGVHQPATGTVTVAGDPVSITDPSAAIQLGIATVFQDLALCENLDVVDNLFLGRELSPWRLDETAHPFMSSPGPTVGETGLCWALPKAARGEWPYSGRVSNAWPKALVVGSLYQVSPDCR